jgi:hypothetical protein
MLAVILQENMVTRNPWPSTLNSSLHKKCLEQAYMGYSSSNYQFKFIANPDGTLQCVICLADAAKDPWQHDKCGKLFCKKCLETNGRHKACPHCRREQSVYFEDSRSK